MKRLNFKTIALSISAFMAAVGAYNALVINADSHVAVGNFVKRSDEMSGVVVAGRNTASISWHKLQPIPMKDTIKPQVVGSFSSPAPTAQEVEKVAAIQEDLKLNLVEVINSQKWSKGLPNTQFTGSISVANGVIDSLSVALPEGLGMNISNLELSGNVFSYDLGEGSYSAMMYQVDTSTYMVTLTNGPLGGTRLRFSAEASVEQQDTELALAQDHDVQVGSFGNKSDVPHITEQLQAQEEMPQTMQAQGFNMESEQVIQ
jgi:hypothetical protein